VRSPDTAGAHVASAGIGLFIGNELRDRRGRDQRIHDHDIGNANEARNWRDITNEIEVEVVVDRCVDRVADVGFAPCLTEALSASACKQARISQRHVRVAPKGVTGLASDFLVHEPEGPGLGTVLRDPQRETATGLLSDVDTALCRRPRRADQHVGQDFFPFAPLCRGLSCGLNSNFCPRMVTGSKVD
jgi:hypothetical protein